MPAPSTEAIELGKGYRMVIQQAAGDRYRAVIKSAGGVILSRGRVGPLWELQVSKNEAMAAFGPRPPWLPPAPTFATMPPDPVDDGADDDEDDEDEEEEEDEEDD